MTIYIESAGDGGELFVRPQEGDPFPHQCPVSQSWEEVLLDGESPRIR